jgi:hypothetical protein
MDLSNCITLGSTYLAKCISHSAKVGKTISFAKIDLYQQLMKFIAETFAPNASCLEQLRMSCHVINKKTEFYLIA